MSKLVVNHGFSSIEDIIADAALGRPFIMVDDESRENEGDLIVCAEFASVEVLTFMARHCCGLTCVALSADIIDSIGLPMAPQFNGPPHATAFTLSVDAKEGTTTGISAQDRATTIAKLIEEDADLRDFVSPGHIFPLRAAPGGPIERPGHTEAGVEIARLAGCLPAAVICEIMNVDGTMARTDDLFLFAQRYNLKMGTITDLVEYIAPVRRSLPVERVRAIA